MTYDLAMRGWGVVVVGASGLVGSAIARRFVELGARVALSDKREEGGEALAAALRERFPSADVFFHPCDLTARLETRNLLSAASDTFGRLDVVAVAAWRRVPAAAGGGWGDDIWERDLEQAWRLESVGVARLAHLAARWIAASEQSRGEGVSGSVVVASALEDRVDGFAADTLARSEGMVAVLAKALAPSTRVNAVVGALTRAGLLGRAPTPDDMADAAALLASPLAGAITGRTLLVDAGASGGA